MKTIEERATDFALKEIICESVEELELCWTEVDKRVFEEIRSDYIRIATEQNAIDEAEFKQREDNLFENVCEWISKHYEDYAAQSRGNAGVAATMTLVALREAREMEEITDKEEIDTKKYDEEYLNSKIEAYGKAHPNGNKEDLAMLDEMRGYDMEE